MHSPFTQLPLGARSALGQSSSELHTSARHSRGSGSCPGRAAQSAINRPAPDKTSFSPCTVQPADGSHWSRALRPSVSRTSRELREQAKLEPSKQTQSNVRFIGL
jgi:hypothetical protein